MAGRAKRRRITIAAVMASVAVFGLLLGLVAPVARQGRPPCLSSAEAIRWLAARPGAASCNDCHSRVSVADRLRALVPPQTPTGACTAGSPGARGAGSCVSCHANVAGTP
jgi:hypothetical protein